MKLTIDTEAKTISWEDGPDHGAMDLYGKESFEALSELWVKVGWNQKYSYTFSWLGRPIIQLPQDMIRIQEAIFSVKPDVIVETGIAHGGSLIFYASLCRLLEHGRVVGIDIDIRSHNRKAIQSHPLYSLINLVEGNSVDPETVAQVEGLVKPGEKVLVVLDSCHDKDHVAAELEAYHGLVTPGSYLIATDWRTCPGATRAGAGTIRWTLPRSSLRLTTSSFWSPHPGLSTKAS
jgi:cephalosporin hydroxylase